MAVSLQALRKLQQLFDLRAIPLVVGNDQRRMAAGTAQPHEGRQDGNPVGRIGNPLDRRTANRLVLDTLVLGEFDREEDFRLGRQVLQDIAFQAAQNERHHELAQRGTFLLARRVVIKDLLETSLRAEKSRQDKIEERPELQQVVLDRRTRRHDSEIGEDPLGGSRPQGGGIFNRLGFVQHSHIPMHFFDTVDFIGEQPVTDNQHVASLQLVDLRIAVFREVNDVQRRGESQCFRTPVVHQRGRHHDERRPVLRDSLEEDEQLDRLSQAHVIGQARPAELASIMAHQPTEGVRLVRAKRDVDIARQGGNRGEFPRDFVADARHFLRRVAARSLLQIGQEGNEALRNRDLLVGTPLVEIQQFELADRLVADVRVLVFSQLDKIPLP